MCPPIQDEGSGTHMHFQYRHDMTVRATDDLDLRSTYNLLRRELVGVGIVGFFGLWVLAFRGKSVIWVMIAVAVMFVHVY